ncbi:PDR/VanB family oxidoreductase [Albirhodobacter sp. R86504]|uniref:PDR/VanB family oxidoreductase n=1 Tax=Albirhodobacter sp. R86504 TaxID=3093848 RepID=UPI00366EA402
MTPSNTLTLTVSNRIDDLGDIMRIDLVGDAPLPPVTAGAHIDLAVDTPDGPVWRQYSLCGDPKDQSRWELGILRDPASRGGSTALHAGLTVGTRVTVEGPRNHFPLAESAHSTVLFGGGIGVTPMLAMAWELHARAADFTLHYATRSADRTAFLDLIATLPFRNKIVLHHDDSDKYAPIDPARDIPAADQHTHLYICGPLGFMEWIIAAAEAQGHAARNIHREYFAADVDTTGESFVVECAQSKITVRVGPDDTIAKALARAGVKIEVKCEEGICGTCVTDVIEGDIDHRDHFLTEEERADMDQICACCSRGCGPKLVLDI